MLQSLTNAVESVLKEQFEKTDSSVKWERPQDLSHGDLALSLPLQIAKSVGKNPKEIAQIFVEDLASLPEVEKVEVAGPGYVNVWLKPMALLASLNETREACTAKVKREKEHPVIVEYSGPNIAKPLGVHHLLSTLIGQAIGNLYEHAGYNTIRWNYLGDWGTQFGKLAVAIEQWGDGRDAAEYSIDELLDLYVRFHEEVEENPVLDELARSTFRKLEEGDKDLREFWEKIVRTTKAALGEVYSKLHVSFDLDIGESFYEDKMESILEEGVKKDVFKEGEEGALIIEFSEESNLPPYLVRKSDGATLYSTRDIAQMHYRIETYNPQEILIVTDISQKLHFEQLQSTCDKLEWDLPAFENVLVGRMRFADKTMSTRKGTALKLEEMLSEAIARAESVIEEHGEKIQTDDPRALAEMMGIGAIAYGILSQNRKMDIVFDWDKMLSFEGNSAPYLQYTHARAKSVLEKAGEDGEFTVNGIDSLSDKERALINTLLQFARILEEARALHMPHLLANYLYELCQDFNAFYNDIPILKAEEPLRTLRLGLTSCTACVLKTGAEILTIRVPDRM